MNNENLKKHLVSAGITFVSTFITTFGALFAVIPYENFSHAGFSGLLTAAAITAVRAAFKPALEKLLGQESILLGKK